MQFVTDISSIKKVIFRRALEAFILELFIDNTVFKNHTSVTLISLVKLWPYSHVNSTVWVYGGREIVLVTVQCTVPGNAFFSMCKYDS